MITILMATYNGERYLRQQMDSLLAQTVQDFVVFICDDCSTDRTLSILKEYEALYPERIKVNQRKENSGNAWKNFMDMMIGQKDEYMMLCDQDDIWLPDKIEVTLQKMKEMECCYGKEMPLLVHTDLKIVDENLQVISDSLIRMLNADYSKTKLHQQIVQNTLTGCTVMYNRALAEYILKKPSYMVMHDWWLMLIASAFGKIDYVHKATILYRQHEKNVVGTKNMKSPFVMLKLFFDGEKIRKALDGSYHQAAEFYKIYGEDLQDAQKELVKRYSEIPKMKKGKRISCIIQLKTYKNGLSRILGQLFYS